ncbi:MAG: DUF4815 domain-containing protein [Candidatus Kerfeldbacteria bacterium]|nr:DUF4815 domain-containing protein [Candidatus Kerfeldbacteria bacterium]
MSRRLILGLTVVFMLLLSSLGGGKPLASKAPAWTPGEHPRLLATAAEKPALLAKVTAPGTVSNAVWTAFLTNNRTYSSYSFSDGAVLYWMTGNTTAGQAAITQALDFVADYPNGLIPSSSSFNAEWYRYREVLLTYDFAYDLLTPTQRQQLIEFIALQGAHCQASGPGYSPGNIHTKFTLCLYGSAVLLEGEQVSITVTDEPVTHGSLNGGDKLRYPIDATVTTIANAPNSGTSDYNSPTDYTYSSVPGVCNRCLNWSPNGNEPAAGATYYVSYTFTPNVARWKSDGRAAFEYYLSYQWHDGYYNAGLNPYGNLTTETLVVMLEMLKRDLGIDYSQNQDVRRIVDMFLYEQLPKSAIGGIRRYNTINDTSAWGIAYSDATIYPENTYSAYRSWLRPFVAWATTAYANDPEGYGQRYLWLWSQSYRNASGTVKYIVGPDWREAWWFNDRLAGSYPVTSLPDPSSWPKHRYFRGKEVIYTRTDAFGANDPRATLASFVAGPHGYLNEHDQGDSGSFTFYSQEEDWAVDSGYGYLTLQDHNAVGIQGLDNGGYGGNAGFGGFAHFDDVVLRDGAAGVHADLTYAWGSSTTTPEVQRADRYLAVVSGGKPSYLIVGDDVQRSASTDTYVWYLHSGVENAIAIDSASQVATITGARTKQTSQEKLAVHTINPGSVTVAQDVVAGGIGSHPRLTVTASNVVNPYYLHLLVPATNDISPTVTKNSVANGNQAVLTWPDGTVDVILWRHGGPFVGGLVGFSNIISDAKLTVVRFNGSTVTGLLALDGRSIKLNNQPLLSVLDGTAPVSVAAFGPTASVAGTDASQLRLYLPTVVSAVVEDGGVSLPVTNNGTVAAINTALPLSEVRRGNGLRYRENFEDGYANDLFRYNISLNPAEQFAVVNGALEVLESAFDWPSFSKRDSTPFRRASIYPTLIPPLSHGDADISFRYRFSSTTGANRAFRVYVRTEDRNPEAWSTNQDYVRLELAATENGNAKNEVRIGERINGAWTDINSNDVLTASLPAAAVNLNDTSWHQVNVRLLGSQVRVTIDNAAVIDGTLPTPPPSNGYIQLRTIGPTVQLDDLTVTAIDRSTPAAPSDGILLIGPDGRGTLTPLFNEGSSPDAQTISLFESPNPIAPNTNPATLTTIAAAAAATPTLEFTGANQTRYHAVSVTDANGNVSRLVPLTVDLTPPAAVTNLQPL